VRRHQRADKPSLSLGLHGRHHQQVLKKSSLLKKSVLGITPMLRPK
jgi:hypothetical protein